MKTSIKDFLKRQLGRLLLLGGVGAYVVVSEIAGHGPARTEIGLPPLITSAHAADAFAGPKTPAWELN